MVMLIRSASLTGFAEVARSLGLDPLQQLREVDISPASLQQVDLKIPAMAVVRLLESAATATGAEDFGLRMARTRQPSNLGPLALLLREEPTLRKALEALQSYLSVHTDALSLSLEEANGVALIREVHASFGNLSARQVTELSLAVTHGFLKSLLGQTWLPLAIHFRHPAPRDESTHRRVFGVPLQFNSELDGIVCRSSDLDTPMPSADPVIARYVHHYLDSLKQQSRVALVDQVQQLIGLQLSGGRCSVERLAQQLGRDRRTLHRQLQLQGESYSSLLAKVRSEQALRLLHNQQRALGEIAGLLGFSSLSVFSYWFEQRFGCRPSVWRQQHRLT
ncbi:AraC-type DNA-binding protein [Pseudomonas pohangensis]|uniref:AraC-type DNA-binding protein n=1 Tax=Pseudomonas pohangensis TaxID=364197 RepID=A0A1H2HI93_9PSED|nr:AraC family transcriptional regulator [Pseudomonas pohangensis]SDU31544.1 AraC-type DNA-binding protein [Pseudomonas pohangensis]